MSNLNINMKAYEAAVKTSLPKSAADNVPQYIKETPLQFTYGKADFSVYEKKYSSTNYFCRKVWAIPTAVAYGIINTIANVMLCIFYGIPKAVFGQTTELKARVFTAVRHLEESMGWMITFFNDKLGTFLVNEARYQIQCYQTFANSQHSFQSIRSSSFAAINGRTIMHYDEAIKLTLLDFKGMNDLERQQAILKFKLQDTLKAFEGEEVFFKKLGEANEEFLKTINFVNFQLAYQQPKTSSIHYVMMSDTTFNKLTVGEVVNASFEQIQFIGTRLAKLKAEALTEEVTAKNVMSLPLVKFSQVSGEAINQFIDQLKGPFLLLVTDKQLQKLDLSKITNGQLENLFRYLDGREEYRRFELLSAVQVQTCLASLNDAQLRYISDAQLKELDLSGLKSNQLLYLFPYINGKKEYARFGLLSVAQVQMILPNLENSLLRYISDAQLEKLDLSKLKRNQLLYLFNYINGKEEYRRFGLLSVAQVQSILPRLDNSQLRYISDVQLQALKLSELNNNQLINLFSYINGKEEYRRFGLLSVAQVQSILSDLNNSQLRYISDEQLKELDLSDLNSNQLAHLFGYVDGKEEYRRFALLSVAQVKTILFKLDDSQLRYISHQQLAKLDLSGLSEKQLRSLFYYVDGKEEYEKFKLLSAKMMRAIKYKVGSEFQKLVPA